MTNDKTNARCTLNQIGALATFLIVAAGALIVSRLHITLPLTADHNES